MTAPVTRVSARAPIDLAHTADFDLGAIRVRPATREIESGGKVERLEPRVMQVLVALCQADGEVISRDDLIARCWAGLAVSDDAINRPMQKIRRLSQLDGGRSFSLQTVPRVGYRLRIAPAAEDSPEVQPAFAFLRRRWKLVSLAALAATIAVAWATARPQSYAIGDVEMVAQSQHMERDPTLTPDGRFVVYVVTDTVNSTHDLFARDLVSGEELQLTDTPAAHERSPAMSPTGDRLAFTRRSSDQEQCHIFVRAFPRGLDHEVGACEGAPYTLRLSWTPDGRALAYSDVVGGIWRIRLLDLETGSTSDLVPPAEFGVGDYYPTFSPDGRRVAFVRYSAIVSGDVYVYDLQGRRLTRLTTNNSWAQVAWADSRRILVITPARGGEGAELWLRDIARGRGERLLPGLSRLRRPAIAGDLLALEFETVISHIRRLTPMSEASVSRDHMRGGLPAFSPDGALAFVDQNRLYVQRRETAPQRVVELGAPAWNMQWSPDGRRLVYLANQGEHTRHVVLDVANRNVRNVPLTSDEQPGSAGWSADGRSIVFAAYGPSGVRLLRVGLDGGTPVPVSDFGWAEPIETAEGLFARSTSQPGIWRLTPGRSAERVFSEPSAPAIDENKGVFEPRPWTVSNGRVYALSETAGQWRVLSRSLAGGPVSIAAQFEEACFSSLTVSPTTGEIVCATVTYQYDVGVARIRRD